jgi:protein gp37
MSVKTKIEWTDATWNPKKGNYILKGFTYLTPVSLIPHHLASLWKSSVDAVVFASLRDGS